MIKLILILLLIHYSLFLLNRNKTKNPNLYCGIFGWFGKNPKKFNKDKFDKLGIFNVERGKTSCGVSLDGELFIGIGDQKIYSDFIKNRDITPKQFPYVLGHTRNASPGMPITANNAHPFGFGSLNDSETYEFIGVHNGTVYNSKELAKKYNIEPEETKIVINKFNVKTEESRSKIDSEILLEILYNSKNFKVLSEYNGTAALVFINLNEPDAVWVWKGASRTHTYLNTDSSEERPLFYYQETPNSLYISSIEDSLLTIGGKKDENVFTFDENTIYKIKQGNVSKAEKIKVSRKNALQKESSFSNTRSHVNNYNSTKRNEYREIANGFFNKNSNCKVRKNDNTLNIFNEKLLRDTSEYGKRPYFLKLRYLRNGHPINGIYTWIMGYGFYYLTDQHLEVAKTTLKSYVGKSFKNGEFELNKKITLQDDFVPFEANFNIEENIHFFIEGVKLKSYLDFEVLHNKKKKYPDFDLSIIELSHCSQHPVCKILKVTPSIAFQDVTFEGKDFTGSIVPLGSEKRYRFKEGRLVEEVPLKLNTYRMGFSMKPVEGEKKETKESAEEKSLMLIDENNSLLINHFPKEIEDDDDGKEFIKQYNHDIKTLMDQVEEESSEALIVVETLLETIQESGFSENIKIKMIKYHLNKIKNYFYKLTEIEAPETIE